MSNNDKCIYCGVTRGEIRAQTRYTKNKLPCLNYRKQHQYTKKPKKQIKPLDDQLALAFPYEDL